jgi:hypothetical protein
MARRIPPAPINRPFVHNAAQPARPRKERRSQRIAEPVEIIDRFEVNIGDFIGSDTEKIKAAVAAAAALDKPAVIKLEHATTYTLTETIAVPKNYILIDLNQAVITRSTDYGNTFEFGYDIANLNLYRDNFARTGVVNGTIQAVPDTMTSGFHISFRHIWMPVASNLIIFYGNSGIELRSCVEFRGYNVFMEIHDRPGVSVNRFGLLVGAISSGFYPGAGHFVSDFNIWGSRPWLNPFPGSSLSVGVRIIGCDGFWMEKSHVAGAKDANYQLLTQFGNFIGNTSFVNCMSDKTEGTGLQLSASFGTIDKVFWDGWISGGPARTIDEKTVTITKGAAGTSDTLPDSPVYLVKSVTQGGTTYIEGTDYNVGTDTIDWSPAGAEPATSSEYSVTYTFTPFSVINDGYGVNISSPGATIATSWPIRSVQVRGMVEGHAKDAVRISALRTNNIQLSELNISTNIPRGGQYGGISIEKGRNISIENYMIDGWENARYGIRVTTDPATGSGAIGIVDDVMIRNGRIKNCSWYNDEDSGVPGIGLLVTATPTNVIIDNCNARNNPINIVQRGSAFHEFPVVVTNSPSVNPEKYTVPWNPGTIASESVATLNITASGVALGDFVNRIAFDQIVPNQVFLFAQARTDQIDVWMRNEGTASTTVASGVVTVEVSRNY